MPDLIADGLPDPRPWALGFFGLFTLLVLAAWWLRAGNTPEARRGDTPLLAEAIALQLYGGTVLLTQVHENHAYGAAALLGAAWWLQRDDRGRPDRELAAIYAALSVVVSLNLYLFYGWGEDLGTGAAPRLLFGIDTTALLSVANLCVFGWWLSRWIRPLLGRSGAAMPWLRSRGPVHAPS